MGSYFVRTKVDTSSLIKLVRPVWDPASLATFPNIRKYNCLLPRTLEPEFKMDMTKYIPQCFTRPCEHPTTNKMFGKVLKYFDQAQNRTC